MSIFDSDENPYTFLSPPPTPPLTWRSWLPLSNSIVWTSYLKKSCPELSIFDSDEIPVNIFYKSPSPCWAKLPRSHSIVSRSTLSLTFLYKSIHSKQRSQPRPRINIMNVNSVSLAIVYFLHGQKSLFYNFLQSTLPPTHGLDHPGLIL